jgi:hypothetical protein
VQPSHPPDVNLAEVFDVVVTALAERLAAWLRRYPAGLLGLRPPRRLQCLVELIVVRGVERERVFDARLSNEVAEPWYCSTSGALVRSSLRSKGLTARLMIGALPVGSRQASMGVSRLNAGMSPARGRGSGGSFSRSA